MKLRNKIIATGLVATSLSGLYGCSSRDKVIESKSLEYETDYFASVSMNHNSGIGMTNGDFDSDGDLDLIVGANDNYDGKLYYFENDGKGNFSLKKSEPEN